MAKKKLPKGEGVTNTFTEVVRAKRESGQSAYESFFGSVKDKLREKTDIRQILPQGGLLTALFPQLKAFKAGPQPGDTLSKPTAANSAVMEVGMQKMQINTSIAAKNSLVLPAIHKDVNLMRQNISKLVKVSGGKPVTKVDKDFFKAKERNAAYDVQVASATPTPEVEPEKEKKTGLFTPLIAAIKDMVKGVKDVINEAISGALSKLWTGIKSVFDIGKLGLRALWPFLGRILGFFVTGPGLLILLGTAALFGLAWWIENYTDFGKEAAKNRRALPENRQDIAKPKDVPLGKPSASPSRVGDASFNQEVDRRAQKAIWDKFGPNLQVKDVNGNYTDQYLSVLHTYRQEQAEKLSKEMASKTWALGDSLAQGLGAGGARTDQTTVGAKPESILSAIQATLKNSKDAYKDVNVVLSSGVSNAIDPHSDKDQSGSLKKALGVVDEQLKLLTEGGARVTLMGVGPNQAYEKAGVNAGLAELAKKYGVQFTGPLADITTSGFDKDKVHPGAKGYKEILNRIQGRPDEIKVNPKTGEVVDVKSRDVSTPKSPTITTTGTESVPGPEVKEDSKPVNKPIAEVYDETLLEMLMDND